MLAAYSQPQLSLTLSNFSDPHPSFPVGDWPLFSNSSTAPFSSHPPFVTEVGAKPPRSRQRQRAHQHSGTSSSPVLGLLSASKPVEGSPSMAEGAPVLQSPPIRIQQSSPLPRRKSHQRASSGSSIISAGPPSPFDPPATHPYIVSHDSPLPPSTVDSPFHHGLASVDPAVGAFGQPKPLPSPVHTPLQDSFLAPEFDNYNPDTQDHESNQEALRAMLQALREEHSPAADAAFTAPVPVYSPAVSTASTSTSQHHRTSSDPQGLLSPYRNVFSDRISAANQGHLQAQSRSPAASVSRERSPFRQGSLHAPSVSNFEARSPQSQPGFASASRMREQQLVEAEAYAFRQPPPTSEEAVTPSTISPKDVLLEYQESEEDAKMPLFAPSTQQVQLNTYLPGSNGLAGGGADDGMVVKRDPEGDGMPSMTGFPATPAPIPTATDFTFVSPGLPGSVQLPQQYPFTAQSRRQFSINQCSDSTPEFPAHLTSMESSMSEDAPESLGEIKRPANTMADTGTYTCTYHGCALRFETPAKLQKHKREGHRHAGANSHAPAVDRHGPASSATTSMDLLRNTQAGPHKCERINPSTGKPCNTIFSRPYDLTRHEDTIHNGRKQKVRCQYCTEEKTFSRHDALTRHMRVVHPDVEFGAKSRRRHHS